jgi:hypothetical protein
MNGPERANGLIVRLLDFLKLYSFIIEPIQLITKCITEPV